MYIAIDVGGTKTLVAVFNEDGEIVRSQKHPTHHSLHSFIPKLIKEVDEMRGEDTIDAIAIAAPGVIDYEHGIVKEFGNLDWKNVDLVTPLQKAFIDDVYVDNDANLGALGEANMGAGNDYETNLYVTLSTGIGTGITYQKKLDRALLKSEGGQMHFKHDGKLMLWEKFASGKAFYERYNTFGSDNNDPAQWREWAEDVSVGMGSLMAIVQPDVIVIGGSMGDHFAKYSQFLHDALQDTRSPLVSMPYLVQAKDPSNAVLNGCYVLCKQRQQA